MVCHPRDRTAYLPHVTSKLMFGMKVFYRNAVIFAALPRTLGFETPYCVAFKLLPQDTAADEVAASGARHL